MRHIKQKNYTHLHLRRLDITDKLQQLLQIVLLNSHYLDPHPIFEKDICDRIEERFKGEHLNYLRELNVLVDYNGSNVVLSNGQFYSRMVVDFWVEEYLLEIKCKKELSLTDKKQLGQLLSCSKVKGLILAHYDDNTSIPIYCRLVRACQFGVTFG